MAAVRRIEPLGLNRAVLFLLLLHFFYAFSLLDLTDKGIESPEKTVFRGKSSLLNIEKT